jgi:energy-coupling factor transport system ATP-binding protein
MISIKNLSFSFFNSDRNALDGVSLEIPEGQFLVVTGPSGCGKSTLALAIGGYIPQVIDGRMEGSVTVDGRDTAKSELSELATRVGIVQQDPESQLCTLSVQDEVAFGPENLNLSVDEIRDRVDDSLGLAGAAYLKGRQVHELSGGEKQRVAIASVLAMRPGTLILDEPTSNLDPSCASTVLRTIEALRGASGMTIIVIEHKLDRLMRLADRLVVMDAGRVAIDGRPDEVLDRYRERVKAIGVRLPHRACPVFAADGGGTSSPLVDVRGLKVSYDGKEALKGIDFRAYPSEVVGIIGPNGSGKTTFLNVLMGLLRPTAGTASVLGLDASKARVSEMARNSGFVFQNPNHQIFEKTVYDEAAFACRNFGLDESAVMPMLRKYGLAAYEKKHPLGISFGEKRRLNLCSVLPHRPSLILLDEPFVGQDYVNVTRMCEDLLQLKAEGKSVVLVSHDVDMVYKYCDRIALFKDGRVLVDAAPGAAMRRIKSLGMVDYVPEGCLES